MVGNNKGYEFTLNAKFDAWVENKWRDGKGQKIKNWKTKLANTLPYLKPITTEKTEWRHPIADPLEHIDYNKNKF